MLHQSNLQRVNERISSKPHHKLAPLSTVKLSAREICSNSEELISPSERRRDKTYTNAWWYTENTHNQINFNHPMQILSSRATRTSLPMSNAARKQVGLQSKDMRWRPKNQYLPTHDLSLHQTVMYQDPVSKKRYPAKITILCDEPRSYIITTEEDTQYRKTQTHLKPYQPWYQTNRQEPQWNRDIQANDNQIQSRPRRNVKPPERVQIV